MGVRFVVERSIDEIGYQITDEETKKTLHRIFARREEKHKNRYSLYDLKYNRFGNPFYETFSVRAPDSSDEAGELLKQEIMDRAKIIEAHTGIKPISII